MSIHSITSLTSNLVNFSSRLLVRLLRNYHETVDRFQQTQRSPGSICDSSFLLHVLYHIVKNSSTKLCATTNIGSCLDWNSKKLCSVFLDW